MNVEQIQNCGSCAHFFACDFILKRYAGLSGINKDGPGCSNYACTMKDKELIAALKHLKVETGSLACLGCGYADNCSTHGCAILRVAVDRISGEMK